MPFLHWVTRIYQYMPLTYCWQAWQRGHRDGFRPHVSPELCHNFVQPWRAHRGPVVKQFLCCWCGSVGLPHDMSHVWTCACFSRRSLNILEVFWKNHVHHSREFYRLQTDGYFLNLWFEQYANSMVVQQYHANIITLTYGYSNSMVVSSYAKASTRPSGNLCCSTICSSSWMKSKGTQTQRPQTRWMILNGIGQTCVSKLTVGEIQLWHLWVGL